MTSDTKPPSHCSSLTVTHQEKKAVGGQNGLTGHFFAQFLSGMTTNMLKLALLSSHSDELIHLFLFCTGIILYPVLIKVLSMSPRLCCSSGRAMRYAF